MLLEIGGVSSDLGIVRRVVMGKWIGAAGAEGESAHTTPVGSRTLVVYHDTLEN